METDGLMRRKVREWVRRYLPLELAGWVGELGAAAVAYLWTGSLAAAAVAATVGSSVGYYAPAYISAVRWSVADRRTSPWWARQLAAHLLALRSLAVEFGPAEVFDSAFVRPALIYATPVLLDNVVLGWVVGGFAADVIFYVFAIFSYERFGRWLVRRPQRSEAEDPSVAPTTAPA
jgi:hypothetical protein